MATASERRVPAWVMGIVLLGSLLVGCCGCWTVQNWQREQHRTMVRQAVTSSQHTLPVLPDVQVIQDIPASAFAGRGQGEWEEPRCYYGEYAMVLGSTEDAATVIQQATPVLEDRGWIVDESYPRSGAVWSRQFIRGDQERLILSVINDPWIASTTYNIDLATQKHRFPTIMSLDLRVMHPQRDIC
jgi:hypothetical protein